MSKAILQSVGTLLFILTLLFQFGCSDPENVRTKRLEEADRLQAAGNLEGALKVLENLVREIPEDPDTLGRIGEIYQARGDATMAAFFLEQAHRQDPDDIGLLRKTYIAQATAGEPDETLLESLSLKAPDSMTAPLWFELGRHYTQTDRNDFALNAYLKGIELGRGAPAPEVSVAIGRLFVQFGDTVQAEHWLDMAARKDGSMARTALFDILAIKLKQENWPEVEKIVARLDRRFPGAIEAGGQAQVREELKRRHDAREAAQKEKTSDGNRKRRSMTRTFSGKTGVVADLEAVRWLAETPALEQETDRAVASTVAFDPDIAIEPAAPFVDSARSGDRRNNRAGSVSDPAFEARENQSALRPPDLAAILTEAEKAKSNRDFERAIRLYWQALGRTNDDAAIWNGLSQTYFADGQIKNAETTALESIRLQPYEVGYTLDYLRVAQRSKRAGGLLAEIETAYDRFPKNPEIALSLARAYERVGNDDSSARSLYRRFLEIAPNHPLRREAEAALTRLP